MTNLEEINALTKEYLNMTSTLCRVEDTNPIVKNLLVKFSKWKDKQFIDKSPKWIKDNLMGGYTYRVGESYGIHVNDFL